jgi:hypothetical protein
MSPGNGRAVLRVLQGRKVESPAVWQFLLAQNWHSRSFQDGIGARNCCRISERTRSSVG